MTQVDKTPEKISEMFNEISKSYDKNNNIISFGLHKKIKKSAIGLLDFSDNIKILDLCCGTGDVTEILANTKYTLDICGIDFSKDMISVAQKRFPKLKFKYGDATTMPDYKNSSVDIITMAFGLRNINDRQAAIKESYRVLKNGGQFLHLDFGYKNIFSVIFNLIAITAIKLLYGNTLPYKYLIQSKKEFPEPEELIKEFEREGFKLKKKKDFLFGVISAQVYGK